MTNLPVAVRRRQGAPLKRVDLQNDHLTIEQLAQQHTNETHIIVILSKAQMDEKKELAVVDMYDENQERSKRALRHHLSEHGLPILASIKKLLRQHGIKANVDEMAGDVFQELVVQLLRRAEDCSLRAVRSLEEYLYGAARKCALSYMRKEANRNERLATSETFWEETDLLLVQDGLKPSEVQELENALRDCIEALEGLQRVYIGILAAHYDDPPTPTEIADMYKVSPASVRNRLSDARKKLNVCLRKKGYAIPSNRQGDRK